MNKSNYIFRGQKVSMKQNWTGEYQLINNETGVIICMGSLEAVQKEYDKMNEDKTQR